MILTNTMDVLSYPFDVKLLNRKKKAVMRELLEKPGLVENHDLFTHP